MARVPCAPPRTQDRQSGLGLVAAAAVRPEGGVEVTLRAAALRKGGRCWLVAVNSPGESAFGEEIAGACVEDLEGVPEHLDSGPLTWAGGGFDAEGAG